MGLPLLFSDMTQCETYHDFNELERTLARLFWPGALTIVVSIKSPLSSLITGGRMSVAARIPDHVVPRSISKLIGAPIVGTSANVTGGPSPFAVETARNQLGDRVDLYLDAGPSMSKSNSTIVGVEPGTPANIRIYREGELSTEKLTEKLRVDSDASRFWSTRLVYSAK
jgi:tRNA threonylcarbamoyl adenosine modification protein (Sua5/YciO/YrdC/YwlC family)